MKEEQLKQLWQLHNSLVADLLHAKNKIKQLQELIKDLERFEPADHYNNERGKQ